MIRLALLLSAIQLVFGNPDGYIIGGEVSEKGRWPWVLSMTRLRETGNFTHTCGAALLTPDWILTAAHCVDGSDPSTLRILAGAFNQTAQDQEQTLDVQTIFVHPDYDPTVFNIPNDVAVAQLTSEADLDNEFISLMTLPRSNDVFANNTNCWATGWGRYDSDPDNFESSPVLKELNGRMPDQEHCEQIWDEYAWPGFGETYIDPEVHVCFGGPDDGICHGDSGSPLNCDMTGNGDWAVAGVASWGSGETCLGATGIYAGITTHLDWIRDTVPGV